MEGPFYKVWDYSSFNASPREPLACVWTAGRENVDDVDHSFDSTVLYSPTDDDALSPLRTTQNAFLEPDVDRFVEVTYGDVPEEVWTHYMRAMLK